MTKVIVSGNIAIRPMTFESGPVVEGHKHNFDHTSYVVKGALRFEVLDANGSVTRAVDKRASDGQNWVLIRAGVCHRITALEPDSLGHCIYNHRDEAGVVVERYEGWEDSYV